MIGMTKEELSGLQQELLTIQKQMNQLAATVREIDGEIKAGSKSTQAKLPSFRAELGKQGEAFKKCAQRGVLVYQQLKAAGFATKQLDEWCEKVRKLV